MTTAVVRSGGQECCSCAPVPPALADAAEFILQILHAQWLAGEWYWCEETASIGRVQFARTWSDNNDACGGGYANLEVVLSCGVRIL